MTNAPTTLPRETYAIIADHIIESEKPTKHPYLDIKGKVTIGTGFLADDEETFAALDLGFKKDGVFVPATDAEKRAAYQQMIEIHEQRNGDFETSANFYEPLTTIRISPDANDAKLRKEITSRVEGIRTRVGDKAWDKLNDQQKAAVVDIVYANGSLEKFPELKDAIIAGDDEAMANESTFYTDKENGKRDMNRLKRNYAALSGLEQEESDTALDTVLKKSPNPETAPDSTADAQRGQENEPFPESTTNSDDDAIQRLGASLTTPGDMVDEALLKDDLTESELSILMHSRPYLSTSDPRHRAVQDKVKLWHEDRWGTEPARVDATGRMVMDEKPWLPAPTFSTIPVEYPSGRPLDDGLSRIANTVMDQARRTSAPEAVRTLQNTLNNQDEPLARPVPMLKTDGTAGPKTRRALRFATAAIGADRLLRRFGGRELL